MKAKLCGLIAAFSIVLSGSPGSATGTATSETASKFCSVMRGQLPPGVCWTGRGPRASSKNSNDFCNKIGQQRKYPFLFRTGLVQYPDLRPSWSLSGWQTSECRSWV